jgi:ABC-type lipoprotein release transport system permease subunit
MVIILFVFIVYAIIAVFSRTTEIGIMRSIGSGPMVIFMMLMYEALIIGLIAVAIGAVLGGYLAWYFQVHPIALGGEQLEAIIEQSRASGFKMDPYMGAVFSWPIIGYSSLFVLVLNLVAVIYPAIKVIRKRPIDAIHDM